MIDDQATVTIIDGDDSSRERLRVLLESAGFMVEPLASAEAYLETSRATPPIASCWTCDCRGAAVSIFRLSSERQHGKYRLCLSPLTMMFERLFRR